MNVATTLPVIPNMAPNTDLLAGQLQMNGTPIDFAAAMEAAAGLGAVIEDAASLLTTDAGAMNNNQEQDPTINLEQAIPLIAAQAGFVPQVQAADQFTVSFTDGVKQTTEADAVVPTTLPTEAKPIMDQPFVQTAKPVTAKKDQPDGFVVAITKNSVKNVTPVSEKTTDDSKTIAPAVKPADEQATLVIDQSASIKLEADPAIQKAAAPSDLVSEVPTALTNSDQPAQSVEVDQAMQNFVETVVSQPTTKTKPTEANQPVVAELNAPKKTENSEKAAPPVWAAAWQKAKPAEQSHSALAEAPVVATPEQTSELPADNTTVADNLTQPDVVLAVQPQTATSIKTAKTTKQNDVQPVKGLTTENTETSTETTVRQVIDKKSADPADTTDTPSDERHAKSPPAWAAAWQNAKPAEQSHSPLVTAAMTDPVADPNAAAGTEVARQIIDKAEMSWQNGDQTIKIKLKPDYFGEVQITLVKSESGLTAQIKTDNEQTSHLLTAQINQLQESLQSKGLNVSQINIQYSSAGSDMASRQQAQPGQTNRQNQTRRTASNTSRSAVSATETSAKQSTTWAGSNKIDYLA